MFLDNRGQVNGPGYGIYVQSKHLMTVVACSNHVDGGASGSSNEPCL